MLMRMRGIIVAAFILLKAAAIVDGNCTDDAPFDCPGDTLCTSWSDGCNDCGCNDGATEAFCTLMMCPCLDDNSCIPSCNDNDQCVPQNSNGIATSDTASPFLCPEGTSCTIWNDGCNSCRADALSTEAVCTEMNCPCYEDNSCLPVCNDNDECVPATSETTTDAAAATNVESSAIGGGAMVQFSTAVFFLLAFCL